MAMKRVFEILVHTEGILKIRLIATAWAGESRSQFNARTTIFADTVGIALADKYGSSKVEFIKR
jgi:hypothetical protein